jgi:DNA polymerase/3'-5' exonuclease PolX
MMEDGLEEIRKSLKDLVQGKKIRNFTVMSPLQLFPNDSDCEEEQEKIVFWGTDPVHLTAEGYDELVKALAEAAVSGTYERAATAPADVTTNIPRKKKQPQIYKRKHGCQKTTQQRTESTGTMVEVDADTSAATTPNSDRPVGAAA